jgi:hypothetical protein
MDANKEYAQSLMKFWEKNFNKLDRTQFEKGDMPKSLGKWLYEIEHYKDVRHWSVMEAAWLGLGWYKGDRQNLPCRFNEENKKVPEGYFLWDYDGEQFLVDCETHDAYRTRKVEKVIRYEVYEPINE